MLDLYNKRYSFPISILQMLYLLSHASSKVFDALIGAGILKIGRSTTDLNNSKFSGEALLSRMINQGAKLKSI